MRNSRSAPLLVIAVVISLFASSGVALSGCGESPPVTAYKQFEKALNDGDLGTACSLLSSKGQEGTTKEQFIDMFSIPSMREVIEKMPSAKIVSCEVEGDRAVITAEGTGLSEGKTSKTALVLEDGEWKLDSAPGP